MTRVTYTTTVGPGVPLGEAAATFGETVDRVLADPRGWAKYGYTFVRATHSPQLRIRLETAAVTERECRVPGFSCWRAGVNDIVVNLANWTGGSRSRLPLDRYRTYVICHEVGHSLGLDHQPCPAAECRRRGMRVCPASVMMQMTRGPEHVSPCAESEWPLDPDWKTDDPRGHPPTGRMAVVVVLAVAIAIIVCIMAIAANCARVHARWKKGGPSLISSAPWT